MFNSNNLNFYYNNIFIQDIYTMSQATINRGNYGLSIFLGFTIINPETGEVNNIVVSEDTPEEETIIEEEG